MTATVDVRAGSVYISAEVRNTYFKQIQAVVLLIEDNELSILPVHHMAAGGCLLKTRNSVGDCVASAPDDFRFKNLEDLDVRSLPARWSTDRGALIVELP